MVEYTYFVMISSITKCFLFLRTFLHSIVTYLNALLNVSSRMDLIFMTIWSQIDIDWLSWFGNFMSDPKIHKHSGNPSVFEVQCKLWNSIPRKFYSFLQIANIWYLQMTHLWHKALREFCPAHSNVNKDIEMPNKNEYP